MDHVHHLLAQTDRIALRYEDDAVERIRDQEDRQVMSVLQLHVLYHQYNL